MSVDLLGPASQNAVSVRPAEYRVIGAADTWFKPCTDPTAQDGTFIAAAWLNAMLAQIRHAIDGMGITRDNTDDDMLLKAIKAAAAAAVAAVAGLPPVHIEVESVSGTFTFTPSVGQLIINGAQTWIWRALTRFSTSSFAVGALTFATAPAKTYHLRWQASGTGLAVPAATYPYGRFVLRDLADAAYNPSGLTEDNLAFDTGWNDMLIARVVTDGANNLTITALANKLELIGGATDSVVSSYGVGAGTVTPTSAPRIQFTTSDASAHCASRFTTNWGRAPRSIAAFGVIYIENFAGTNGYLEGNTNLSGRVVSRYQTDLTYSTDWSSNIISGGVLQVSSVKAYATCDMVA